MKYLLDTHTLLWYYTGSDELPDKTRKLIENDIYGIYISIASFWEINIKKSTGKLDFPFTVEKAAFDFKNHGIDILPIKPVHLDRLLSLPYIHKDPFDRLLIAQAISEDMTIITRDEKIPLYAVKTAW